MHATTKDGIYDIRAKLKKVQSKRTRKRDNGEHPSNQSRGTNMKQMRLLKMLAIGVACAAAFGTALGQTTTTTTTTDPVTGTTTTQQTTTSAAGNIVTYTPDSDYFMFRTTADAAPTRYYYTRDTAVVDPEGRVVSWSAIRPDMPATVYYTRVGDRVMVRRVVLSRPVGVIRHEETTTTTTTER
jgi:hypothetical protein